MVRKNTVRKRAKKSRRKKTSSESLIAPDQVEQTILVVRGQKVLLDEQLAGFYDVETRAIVQAVGRNEDRFPVDFMFQLTKDEWEALKSQSVISNPQGRGGRRTPPYAFTEQGVAMLSSVLRSKQAVVVHIEIMRAFVRLRQLLSAHKELAARLAKLEQRMHLGDHRVKKQFEQVFALLDQLFNPPEPRRKPIGFLTEAEEQKKRS